MFKRLLRAWNQWIFYPRFLHDWAVAREQAQNRAEQLLLGNLTTDQIVHYEKQRCFYVRGGATGRQYRIRRGTQMNVDVLDDHSRVITKLCFVPVGDLVEGDILLAQKLALELFETEVLRTAHWSLGC